MAAEQPASEEEMDDEGPDADVVLHPEPNQPGIWGPLQPNQPGALGPPPPGQPGAVGPPLWGSSTFLGTFFSDQRRCRFWVFTQIVFSERRMLYYLDLQDVAELLRNHQGPGLPIPIFGPTRQLSGEELVQSFVNDYIDETVE